MKIQNIKYQTNNSNMSNSTTFKGLQKNINQLSSNELEKSKIISKTMSFAEKIETGVKKLLGLYNVHSNGVYKIKFPLFEPCNLIAEEGIELGSLCKMGKNHSYTAPIIKIYGKAGGNINGMDTWLYPKSKATKTAQIMTDELTIITNSEIEKGANVFANKTFIFPQAKINAEIHSPEINKIGI